MPTSSAPASPSNIGKKGCASIIERPEPIGARRDRRDWQSRTHSSTGMDRKSPGFTSARVCSQAVFRKMEAKVESLSPNADSNTRAQPEER
eukprot:4825103-Alexandrium_andersonii.AAC.1